MFTLIYRACQESAVRGAARSDAERCGIGCMHTYLLACECVCNSECCLFVFAAFICTNGHWYIFGIAYFLACRLYFSYVQHHQHTQTHASGARAFEFNARFSRMQMQKFNNYQSRTTDKFFYTNPSYRGLLCRASRLNRSGVKQCATCSGASAAICHNHKANRAHIRALTLSALLYARHFQFTIDYALLYRYLNAARNFASLECRHSANSAILQQALCYFSLLLFCFRKFCLLDFVELLEFLQRPSKLNSQNFVGATARLLQQWNCVLDRELLGDRSLAEFAGIPRTLFCVN